MRHFSLFGWSSVGAFASLTFAFMLLGGAEDSHSACASSSKERNAKMLAAYTQLKNAGAQLQPHLMLVITGADCAARGGCICTPPWCDGDPVDQCGHDSQCECFGRRCDTTSDCGKADCKKKVRIVRPDRPNKP